MKAILICALVLWCIGFAVIVALSYRKYRRRKQFSSQLRSVLESSAAQAHRDAVESARVRVFEGRRA